MAEARKGRRGRRGPRPTGERLRRLLLMLPWLMERGEVTVAEMAARFHLSEAELVGDLELAAVCGLPPYADELIDLYIDEGPDGLTVYSGVPRLFTRPFRLTAPEGFALLASGRTALGLPGADPHGALARALDKLEARLGGASVAVDPIEAPWMDTLRDAISRRAVLAVRYWTASRDEITERTIVPRVLYLDRRDWYLLAEDGRSGADRTFRVDRFEEITETGTVAAARAVEAPTGEWFSEDEDIDTAVVLLDPAAAWVVERYPIRDVVHRPDGRLQVTLPVASERFLGRLLLRLGPQAAVVEPERWADLAARTARTVLARYDA